MDTSMNAEASNARRVPLVGICQGCTVFAGGRKVGIVDAADADGFIVKVGILGRRRVFVPHTHVERVDEKVQAVYLSRFTADS